MCSFSLCFSAELLVLIAAIFLLVYITKQQVSKWFTYGSVAIIIVTLIMMICSICCAMCMRHCSQGGMQDCGYNQNCSPQMMMCKSGHCGGMGMNHCSPMMMQGESCEGMAGCEEMEEGGECCESHGGEKTHKTIIIEKDTVVKKK